MSLITSILQYPVLKVQGEKFKRYTWQCMKENCKHLKTKFLSLFPMPFTPTPTSPRT